jgi:hypothetical protein
MPPSTCRHWPVILAASGDARNATAFARLAVSGGRFIGVTASEAGEEGLLALAAIARTRVEPEAEPQFSPAFLSKAFA